MQKQINNMRRFMRSKHRIVMAASGIFLMVLLLSNANGPAKNGTYVTGAPFNSSLTCTSCHGGGNFGATMSVKLYDASNTVVTSYKPDSSYTLKISMKYTTGVPKFGFQTTCATSLKAGVNSWGTLPTTMHAVTNGGHTYVEHSKPLTSGTIKIPWKAPAKGTGSVIFYVAGNEVNGDGGTGGDQPVSKKVTITEGLAFAYAVTSINATLQNNTAVVSLKDGASLPFNGAILEKSFDEVNFSPVEKISTDQLQGYRYTDHHVPAKAFYRLKTINEDGTVSYSNIAAVENPASIKNQLSLYSHAGLGYIMFHNDGLQQKVQVTYSDIAGNILYTELREVNAGDNAWPIPRDKVKGMAIVNVVTKTGIKSSLKIGVN